MNKREKDTVEKMREFNRFYTVRMGFLSWGYLNTDYSVAEVRTLFELMLHPMCMQADIAKTLMLDKSYLSRIIKKFEKNGLLIRQPSELDKRTSGLLLTASGTKAVNHLIAEVNKDILQKLEKVPAEKYSELILAMETIINILSEE